MKKILKILLPVVLAAVLVLASFVGFDSRDVYDAALTAMEEGDYEMARSHLERLEDNNAAQQLLSELHFVPTRVATTYADGTTELKSYAYNRKGCLVKAELTQMEQVVSTTSYTYTDADQMLTKDLLLAEQTRPEAFTENFYDELGRLICSRTVGDIATFQQTTYTYDQQGRCVAAFAVEGDGSWVRTEYRYDSEGQLTSEVATTDQGAKTVRHYSQEGHLLVVSINGKLAETYTYNQKGLLVQATYAGGRETTNTYNDAGQLIESVTEDSPAERMTTTQEYNEKGLLVKRVQETYKGVFTETFKYNKKGLCTTYVYETAYAEDYVSGTDLKDVTEKYTYTYDRHGNVETETYEAETGSYERTYKWKSRHYPTGVPQMIADLLAEYDVKD